LSIRDITLVNVDYFRIKSDIWSIDPQLVIVVLHKNILRNVLQYYLALATLF